MGIEGSYLWGLKDKIDRKWIEGYNVLPDKEEMMASMSASKVPEHSPKDAGSESLLEALKNDHSISPEDKKSMMSLLEGALANEKKQRDDEEGEDDGEVSVVAKSMGQDTIDMLSNAKMRYENPCQNRAIAVAAS